MRRRLKTMFTLFLIAIVALFAVEEANAASDIEGNTHEENIRLMMELKIMVGYEDGTFRPGNQVTRAQFAKMIAEALNLPKIERPSIFADVTASHGSKNYIMAAAEAGIITGDNGRFMPNNPISRQHMALMMGRALRYSEVAAQANELPFKDRHLINENYHADISMIVYYGIFQGDGDQFKPLNNATRGQGASVIARFLQVLETGEPVHEAKPPLVEGPNDGKPNEPKPEEPKPDEPKPEEPKPEEPKDNFHIATVSDDGKTTIVKSFSTFAEADRAVKSGQVLMYQDDILKMDGGIGYSRGAFGSSVVNIYTDATLRNAETYVAANYELEYVRATENYVQVKLNGKNGYVKQENIKLLPWHAVQGRSYYQSAGGDLYHFIYSERNRKYDAYVAGKAPAFMKAGERYYSWDGLHFSDARGVQVGQAAQYFQYIPARSKTNYSAEEIDDYIMKQLTNINNTTALYTDALTKSKLIGLGSLLKEKEEEYKINAMLILALAQHESAYGMSKRAQEENNLFGLRIFDDNPDSIVYPSVEENIQTLIDQYLNKNYIPPTGPYAYGAAFGTKSIGFNVKYASDPFWGSKAAGHWYRADKMMGGKDLNKAHRIALTTTTNLNVRADASTSQKELYKYRYAQMPVIILEDLPSSPWKKVLSDHIAYDEAFIHGSYLTELPLAK